MNKTELGNKHLCTSCNTKFYDLQKEIPVCPKCGEEIILKVKRRLGRPPLNKKVNIKSIDKKQEKKLSVEENFEKEDELDKELNNIVSIEDIDDNILDPNTEIDIEDNENDSDNLSGITNIDIDDKNKNHDS
jgi:uncharacterized protein (TIGR02300 family)